MASAIFVILLLAVQRICVGFNIAYLASFLPQWSGSSLVILAVLEGFRSHTN